MEIQMKEIEIDETKLRVYDDGTIERFYKQQKKWIIFSSKVKTYWRMMFCNNYKQTMYLVHRIIAHAFINFDLDSKLQIDHIDRNIHNNKLVNLRVVTNQQNQFNRDNIGFQLYNYVKQDGTITYSYQSQLRINGKLITKRYSTEEDAKQGYLELKEKYHIIV